MPLGNGHLGAMIYGGVSEELIQFNEKTVWSEGPGTEGYIAADRKGTWKDIEEICKLLLSGEADEAQPMSKETVKGLYEAKYPRFGCYQTFGEFCINTVLTKLKF